VPCQQFAPVFDAAKRKVSGIRFERVGAEEDSFQELSQRYGVRSFPRIAIVDRNGNALYCGSPPREEESLVQLVSQYR